jgi:hypothetical protein
MVVKDKSHDAWLRSRDQTLIYDKATVRPITANATQSAPFHRVKRHCLNWINCLAL